MTALVHKKAVLFPAAGPSWVGGTWDPANKSSHLTLSGGNLVATQNDGYGNGASVLGTVGKSSGSWKFAAVITSSWSINSGVGLALSTAGLDSYLGSDTDGFALFTYGQGVYYNGSSVAAASIDFDVGDTVLVEYDPTGDTNFYVNGVLSATIATPISGTMYPAACTGGIGEVWTGQFT